LQPIDYRPELRYELPRAIRAEAGQEVPQPVYQTAFFSLEETISTGRELEKELDQFVFLPADLLRGVSDFLAVARDLLESQRRLLPNEKESFLKWAGLAARQRALQGELDRAGAGLTWEVFLYPEDYPEYAEQLAEYNRLKKEYDELQEKIADIARVHYSVADVVNIVSDLFDRLRKVSSTIAESANVESTNGVQMIPGAVSLLERIHSSALDNYLSRLASADIYRRAADAFLEVQDLRLNVLPQVRKELLALDDDAEVGEAILAVERADDEYVRRLLDLKKIQDIFLERVAGGGMT